MCLQKDLVPCPAMNPHIDPSAPALLCGRRARVEAAQQECKLAGLLQLSVMDLSG